MDTVLLILTSTQGFHRGFARAIELARDKHLHTLFILDKKGVKNMSSSLKNMSFVGLKAEGQLTSLVADEYRLRAINMLEELEEHARDLKLQCSTRLAVGDFTKEAKRVIENKKPVAIVINKISDSYLSRYIFNSKLDEVKTLVDFAIDVVDEDEF